jgi:hypothetical protein
MFWLNMKRDLFQAHNSNRQSDKTYTVQTVCQEHHVLAEVSRGVSYSLSTNAGKVKKVKLTLFGSSALGWFNGEAFDLYSGGAWFESFLGNQL